MYRLLVLCLCYGILDYAASTEDITASLYEHCGDLKPQESIQIKLVCVTLIILLYWNNIVFNKTNPFCYKILQPKK